MVLLWFVFIWDPHLGPSPHSLSLYRRVASVFLGNSHFVNKRKSEFGTSECESMILILCQLLVYSLIQITGGTGFSIVISAE